jgi:urease accessory protein
VLRPHYLDDSGQVCYVVVNPGGAYLGADLFLLDIEVQDAASLLLTTQSATKVYRTPGSFAEQRMTVRLGEGARLAMIHGLNGVKPCRRRISVDTHEQAVGESRVGGTT